MCDILPETNLCQIDFHIYRSVYDFLTHAITNNIAVMWPDYIYAAVCVPAHINGSCHICVSQ